MLKIEQLKDDRNYTSSIEDGKFHYNFPTIIENERKDDEYF